MHLPTLFHFATMLFHLVMCYFTFPVRFQLNSYFFPIHFLKGNLRAVLLVCVYMYVHVVCAYYVYVLCVCVYTVYGSALISHCLIGAGFRDTVKIGKGCEPGEGGMG